MSKYFTFSCTPGLVNSFDHEPHDLLITPGHLNRLSTGEPLVRF